jgi:hypothetical protein
LVDSCIVEDPFTLRCIRQENAGPAAARNTGFRASSGEIVIFVDDDIIAPADLILKHVEAHRQTAQAVICGRCPFAEPTSETALFRFVKSLDYDPEESAATELITIDVVASGQISVERQMFDLQEGVYRDDLATPAAEEFELSVRLKRRGICILLGTEIVAIHDHPLTIASLCTQQFKHAIGCAEAAVKYPGARAIKSLDQVIVLNGLEPPPGSLRARLKWLLKSGCSTTAARKLLLGATRLIESVAPGVPVLPLMYRTLLGVYFFAGVREGLRRFSPAAGSLHVENVSSR